MFECQKEPLFQPYALLLKQVLPVVVFMFYEVIELVLGPKSSNM